MAQHWWGGGSHPFAAASGARPRWSAYIVNSCRGVSSSAASMRGPAATAGTTISTSTPAAGVGN